MVADPVEAARRYREGDFAEAFDLFRALALADPAPGDSPGAYLGRAVACLDRLGRTAESDGLRESFAAAHGDDWRALADLAESWAQAEHHGFLVGGRFERGARRGGGRFATSLERDRARALGIMERALVLAGADRLGPTPPPSAPVGDRAGLRLRAAALLMLGREDGRAWRLQELTEAAELPDLEEGYRTGADQRGAPTGPDGEPIFHAVPGRWESAASDGERWRWLLEAARSEDPAAADPVLVRLADFSRSQFGEQTIVGYPGLLREDDMGEDRDRSGAWALHTLGEDETIARLATGVRRFRLPADYDYVAHYRALAARRGGIGRNALQALAETFENRRQYPRAAEAWRALIEAFGGGDSEPGRRLAQIVEPWGELEAAGTFTAGEPAAVSLRFRNGDRARFEARPIDVPRLLADLKAHLEDNPRTIDRERVDVENLGWRIVTRGQDRYLGPAVASWETELEPPPDHGDRRVTVTTPLREPGAFLLTARMENGNESRLVVWVSDTVLVHKRLDGGDWFFAADAATGAPLPGVQLDFFGFRQEATDWQRVIGRRYNVRTTSFSATTDIDGQLVPDPELFSRRDRWLVTATGGGRLAYLGWGPAWGGRLAHADYRAARVYAITDRPAYRPSQQVSWKVWAQEARYDAEGDSPYAGRSFTLRLIDARGETAFEEQVEADRFGGVSGSWELPANAALGVWRLDLGDLGGGTFRVEEYRKPEFEVLVEGPGDPVALGGKVEATIRARYLFGAPVTDAKVVYRVRRSPHRARWYPAGEWDWCFGPGYWWFQPDYPWYPGWRDWATPRPLPFWYPRPSAPPELVAEQEVRIGPDGTARVVIDTALAKELHGDEDHRYEIVAEVTDRSRRTVAGSGEVLVARRPFGVYAWVDRGHYLAGDTVHAEVLAQTLDRAPVTGAAVVTLYRVGYRGGEPQEKAVRRWAMRTDAEGRVRLQLTAAGEGQYRLGATVTDSGGRSIEGGLLFTVAGPRFDGGDLRFNEVELVPDRREYAPGETVRLRVNAARRGAAVLLFARPEGGVYAAPRLLRLRGRSALAQIAVGRADMPNFFVEALTVSRGRVHTELREIVVPPAGKALAVEVLPSAERYRPGEEATVRVRVTGPRGEPFAGSAVLSVYDQAVEQVAGGSAVPGIREFFWKWRRSHAPWTVATSDRRFGALRRAGEPGMRPIGLFGGVVAQERGDGDDAGARRSLRSEVGAVEESATMSLAAPAAAPMAEGAASFADAGAAPGEVPAAVEPVVRREFADTAFWTPNLEVGADGIGEAVFRMPENLTGWNVHAWALGPGAAVGEGAARVVTAKNLLVRVQAPRFFVERDEVVLSANVHSYLAGTKAVRAVLELEGGCLEPLDGEPRLLQVGAGGEARADWRVRAVREGEAIVRVKALTDVESDAMELRFPVYVHGMEKTVSWNGSIRGEDGDGSATFAFTVPAQRRLDRTRLEARFSPTLAGALLDALPYLVGYPYGCTEQTLNRFLPSAIVRRTLRDLGVPLAQVRDRRANLNAQELGDPAARDRLGRRFAREPVFDEAELDAMVRAGLDRLAAMQVADGGWGWFSGWGERSYPHTTAVVVHGLQAAAAAGEPLPPAMLERGLAWLAAWQEGEVAKLRRAVPRVPPWKERADELDALVFATLAEAGREQAPMRGFLVRDRARLAPAGLAHLGLGLERLGQRGLLDAVLRNLGQYVVEDPANQTAWLRLPAGAWWRWWGSETETSAAYLTLLARTDPKGARAAGLAKYLLNNRRHGAYWDSTRDTALCVEALAEFLRASGEDSPNMTVEILVDGRAAREVRVTAGDLFTFDNTFLLEGGALDAGTHTLEFRRRGRGPLYANAYLSYFTLEDFIGKAGLEVRVERAAYRLRREDRAATVSGAAGQAVRQRVERYEREPLADGGELASGDLVEIELAIESRNDYEYLVVEDFKAAGLEPVEALSGYTGDGVGAYLELRDERAAFFLRELPRGTTTVSYRLRAEVPGRFSALPARIAAMYAPELRGNSDEFRLLISDGSR